MATLEGTKAPPFSLKGSDGKIHSLKDYKGKTVVLYFYPKDNTPGCTKEACGFRDRHEELTKQNVVVLGVSRDDEASHDRFIADFKLPFVLLSDPDAQVMKAYGAWSEKAVRSTTVIGPDGIALKHWALVKDAEAHPAEVAAFLAAQ
jgi:thioredoxin-dependent peroxiredoxin